MTLATLTGDSFPREPLDSIPTDLEDELDSYDPEELVGSAEIARRLGVKDRTIQIWRHAPRASSVGFPEPSGMNGRKLLWRWADVLAWHRHRLANLAAGPRERALGHEDRATELGWTGPGGKRAESLTKDDLARIARMKAELVELQQRLEEGEGVTAKTVAELERDLARAKDQIERRGADTQRRAELFAALHDAGVSWDAIGAFVGKAGHVPREAVRAWKKRTGS